MSPLSEVETSWFVCAIWLDMLLQSHLAGGVDHWLVHQEFVQGVVQRGEAIVVSGSHSSNLQFIQSSESKEIWSVSQNGQMHQWGRSIIDSWLLRNNAIKSIILTLSCFCIKHYVCHSFITVSEEVSGHIIGSLILGGSHITLVSFKLMGVN